MFYEGMYVCMFVCMHLCIMNVHVMSLCANTSAISSMSLKAERCSVKGRQLIKFSVG